MFSLLQNEENSRLFPKLAVGMQIGRCWQGFIHYEWVTWFRFFASYLFYWFIFSPNYDYYWDYFIQFIHSFPVSPVWNFKYVIRLSWSDEAGGLLCQLDAGATMPASPKRSRPSNKKRPYQSQAAVAIVFKPPAKYVTQYIDTTDRLAAGTVNAEKNNFLLNFLTQHKTNFPLGICVRRQK